MCSVIILPDGTEIEQLPLPNTLRQKADSTYESVSPKHPLSCLCSFPPEAIEAWLKATFSDIEFERTPFGWEAKPDETALRGKEQIVSRLCALETEPEPEEFDTSDWGDVSMLKGWVDALKWVLGKER